MEQEQNILVAADLRKDYGKGAAAVNVLRNLDLTVRDGEFVAIMGPSGCGKTTLLHILGLMMPPDAGLIVFKGQTVPNRDRARTRLRRSQIGFVFQRFNLISVLSAADNIAVSLRVRGLSDRDGRIDSLLEQLGVAHVRKRKPQAMSIGEQQRVAVARAMAHRPALLLADEPTGNLDSGNAMSLLELFRKMNRQEKQTIVMITHSAEAAACADRVVRMKDGRIVD